MKVQSFNINTVKMTVMITATDAEGTFVNVNNIKIHGHEDKKLHELDAHAREEIRKALRAAADAL